MDEKQIRKLIREDLEYYDKNPDILKEEFIKQFGEELWNQQEALSKLLKIEEFKQSVKDYWNKTASKIYQEEIGKYGIFARKQI